MYEQIINFVSTLEFGIGFLSGFIFLMLLMLIGRIRKKKLSVNELGEGIRDSYKDLEKAGNTLRELYKKIKDFENKK